MLLLNPCLYICYVDQLGIERDFMYKSITRDLKQLEKICN